MKKVVITGGTGLIGKPLVQALRQHYEVVILTRSLWKRETTDLASYVQWNGKDPITSIIDGAYGVINLAGENIGVRRWSKSQKYDILQSRIDAAEAIQKSIEETDHKPEVWIQASATGFYGNSSSIIFDEHSPKGSSSFLADVCELWEWPIHNLNLKEVRTIIIRTGVVLSPLGGLLAKLGGSLRFGLAVIPGSGKQYLPGIFIDDEVRAIIFLLENKQADGTFNLVAPTFSTMEDIVQVVTSSRKSFFTIHIRPWMLNLLFGKGLTEELILANQRVIPKRLTEAGFQFK